MREFHSREQSQLPSWFRWIGVLCIALVLLVGFIQVTHTHSAGQVDRENCSLCNTAHQVAQTVATVTVVVSIHPVWRASAEKPVQRPCQKFIYKLANRPPPVSLIAA